MKKRQVLKQMKMLGCGLLTFGMLLGSAACGQETKGTAGDAQGTESIATESGSVAEQTESEETEEGNFHKEGYPIVTEPVTVRMMGMKHPIHGDWNTLKFFDYMEEFTGVTLEFDTPAADVFEEKKSLAIAGDSYPEVFFGASINTTQQVKWGMEENILIPLGDLIEQYAPNVQAMFEANPGLEASVTAPDGNIYALPQVNESPIAYMAGAYYNGDWLKALGVTKENLPTTIEDFVALLERFRDEDPNGNGKADEIPLALNGNTVIGDVPEYYFLPTFDILSTRIYVEDGTVKYGAQQENYKEYIKFMRELYEEKLLDNSFITSDSVIATAAAKENKVGLMMTALPANTWSVTPEDSPEYYVLGALSSSYTNGERTYSYVNSPFTQGTFAITDLCENPEVMMRWVDYLYSEEGSIFIHYGAEGDLWDYTADGLRQYNEPEGMSAEEYRGGKITPDCGVACPKWVRSETEGSWDDPFQPIRIAGIETEIQPYAKQAFPSTYLMKEDMDRVTTITTDLNKYLEEMVAGFVVGNLSIDQEWENFQSTLTQMNVEELIEIYQKSYDTWAAVNN